MLVAVTSSHLGCGRLSARHQTYYFDSDKIKYMLGHVLKEKSEILRFLKLCVGDFCSIFFF